MGPEYDNNEEISTQTADNKSEFPYDIKSARNTYLAERGAKVGIHSILAKGA